MLKKKNHTLHLVESTTASAVPEVGLSAVPDELSVHTVFDVEGLASTEAERHPWDRHTIQRALTDFRDKVIPKVREYTTARSEAEAELTETAARRKDRLPLAQTELDAKDAELQGHYATQLGIRAEVSRLISAVGARLRGDQLHVHADLEGAVNDALVAAAAIEKGIDAQSIQQREAAYDKPVTEKKLSWWRKLGVIAYAFLTLVLGYVAGMVFFFAFLSKADRITLDDNSDIIPTAIVVVGMFVLGPAISYGMGLLFIPRAIKKFLTSRWEKRMNLNVDSAEIWLAGLMLLIIPFAWLGQTFIEGSGFAAIAEKVNAARQLSGETSIQPVSFAQYLMMGVLINSTFYGFKLVQALLEVTAELRERDRQIDADKQHERDRNLLVTIQARVQEWRAANPEIRKAIEMCGEDREILRQIRAVEEAGLALVKEVEDLTANPARLSPATSQTLLRLKAEAERLDAEVIRNMTTQTTPTAMAHAKSA